LNEERSEPLLLSGKHTFQASFKGQQVQTFELRFKPDGIEQGYNRS